MTPSKKDDEISFESALERVEEIVSTLAEGELTLEQSLASFEEGTRLIRRCQKQLKEVEKKIIQLAPGENGQPAAAPFDGEDAD